MATAMKSPCLRFMTDDGTFAPASPALARGKESPGSGKGWVSPLRHLAQAAWRRRAGRARLAQAVLEPDAALLLRQLGLVSGCLFERRLLDPERLRQVARLEHLHDDVAAT